MWQNSYVSLYRTIRTPVIIYLILINIKSLVKFLNGFKFIVGLKTKKKMNFRRTSATEILSLNFTRVYLEIVVGTCITILKIRQEWHVIAYWSRSTGYLYLISMIIDLGIMNSPVLKIVCVGNYFERKIEIMICYDLLRLDYHLRFNNVRL